jgi:lysophospholipase L1-like esterase
MSRKLIPLVAVSALACILPGAALAKHRKHPARYYLALGDSLARGAQPFGPLQSNGLDQTIATNQGYANDLFAAEKHKLSGLRLKQLGCLGETTMTMMDGGICHYGAGNQLAQAIKFIHKHKIAFITLDIGANDVDGCATATGIDLTCVQNGLKSVQTNVPMIASKLRRAAGRKAKILGMTYYDPFLAEWLQGSTGQGLAFASVSLAKSFNDELVTAYQTKHFKIADVATAFATYVPFSTTTTIAPYPYGPVPVAVADICKWTWMCAPAPRGPNIHANAAGYSEIAKVFKKTLR